MTGLDGLDQRRAPDEVLLGFTTALRAAGVAVTHDRSAAFLEACAHVGLADAAAVRTAGRSTLCGGPDDLHRFDGVFEAYFDHRAGLPRPRPATPGAPTLTSLPETDADGAGESDDSDPVRARASDAEVLRHRDVATLSAGEKQRLAARRLGEPAPIAYRRRGTRPRRVVLLVDVSGSMSGYADALLRVAHRLTHVPDARVETFTVGTRLTHLTRALSVRDPERALVAAGDTVPDWSGGTRLGESLQVFLDRWGRRGLARGAVVVVLSDGWERGDPTLLAEQVRRLQRIAHRVVWVNPHRGKAGYEPVQGGVVAVLPHVDDFLAGHSLATYSELCEVLSRA